MNQDDLTLSIALNGRFVAACSASVTSALGTMRVSASGGRPATKIMQLGGQ